MNIKSFDVLNAIPNYVCIKTKREQVLKELH